MTSIKLSILGAFVTLLALPVMAQAFVTLSSDPLFDATNLVPGQELPGTITLENPTEDTLDAQIQAFGPGEQEQEGELGDALRVVITSGETTFFDASLNEFFAAGEVSLGTIADGNSTLYDVTITLDSEAPQYLMGTSINFDLCVGFAGGTIECGTAFAEPSSTSRGSRSGTRIARTPTPQVLGESIAACTEPYLTQTIKPDQSNDPAEVVKLQTFLRDLEGHSTLEITGVYDLPTQDALRAFQEKYRSEVLRPWGLPMPTAVVYLTTRKMINEIYCQFATEFPLTSEQEAEIAWYREQGVAYRDTSTTTPAPATFSEGVVDTAEKIVETGTGVINIVSEQAAAAASAGSSFFGKVFGFIKSLFSW